MADLSADLSAALGDDDSRRVFPTLPGLVVEDSEQLDDTIVQRGLSGKQWRSTWSTVPSWRFTVACRFLRSSASLLEWQTMVGFWAAHGGRLDSFLWTHPDDSTVTAHPFGVGDGATTVFQLQRTIFPDAFLSDASSRAYWPTFGDGYGPIFEVDSAPLIYKAGSLQTLTTHYTMPGLGIVQFVTPPAASAVLTWTGTYFHRVTFGGGLSLKRTLDQLYQGGSVELLTVKP